MASTELLETEAEPRLSILFQIHALAGIADRLVERALGDSELGGTEFALYSLLAAAEPATPTEVAYGSGMSLANVSRVIARAERRRHVVRTANPRDGRSALVSLTPNGRSAHAAARSRFVEALEQVKAHLDGAVEDVRWALGRYEAALRATLQEEPHPFPGGRPDYSLSYAGRPLNRAEEEEARAYVEWLQWRRDR